MLAHTQVHWLPASVASTIRSPILSPPNPMQTQTLQRMAAALAPIPAPVSSTATGRCGALPVLRGTCHVAKGRRSAAHPFALISSLRHSHRRTHGRHPWGPKSAGAVIRPRGVCTAAAELDRTIEIKLMIAKGTDKLDLTDLNKPLGEIPQEVFELNQLKVHAASQSTLLFPYADRNHVHIPFQTLFSALRDFEPSQLAVPSLPRKNGQGSSERGTAQGNDSLAGHTAWTVLCAAAQSE